jgi:hypothetical protein
MKIIRVNYAIMIHVPIVYPIHHGFNIKEVKIVYRRIKAKFKRAAQNVALSLAALFPVGRYPHLSILKMFAQNPTISFS